MVSAWRSLSALWERCLVVVERDVSRKVDWKSRTECMTVSVARSNCDEYFTMATCEASGLCSPYQNYRRYRGKNSSKRDNGRCQHVTKECWTVHYRLPLNGRKPLRKPNVSTKCPWFHYLIACAILWWRVPWKLNVTGYALYIIFDTILPPIRRMCANFVSSCIHIQLVLIIYYHVVWSDYRQGLDCRIDLLNIINSRLVTILCRLLTHTG
jgi:hypothetical protein